MADPQSVLVGQIEVVLKAFKPNIWRDERAVPAYLSGASLLVVIGQFVYWRIKGQKSIDEKELFRKIPLLNGYETTSRVIESLRFICCLALIAISVTLTRQLSTTGDAAGVYCLLSGSLAYTALVSLLCLFLIGRRRSYLSHHVFLIHFVILSIFTYRDIFPLATSTPLRDASLQNWAWGAYVLLVFTGLMAPLALPSPFQPLNKEDPEDPTPSQLASLFSYFSYSFVDRLIRLAYKKSNLAVEDLPPIRAVEKADYLKDTAYPLMDPFLTSHKPSLLWGILVYFKTDLLIMSIMHMLQIINGFAGPIGIFKILSFLEASDRDGLARPWVWIAWLAFGPVLASVTSQLSLYKTTHLIVRIEAIFSQLVFDHTLRVRVNTASPELPKDKKEKEEKKKKKKSDEEQVKKQNGSSSTEPSQSASPPEGQNSSSSQQEASESSTTLNSRSQSPEPTTTPSKELSNQAGGITNLLTVDIQNVMSGVDLYGIGAVIRVIFCFVLLYKLLGWSALIGCALLIISMPVPKYLVKLRSSIQETRMEKSDARLQAVTQAMSVLRMIKLFGWESQIEKKIKDARASELNYIWWSEFLDMGAHITVRLFPLAAMVGTYACFTLVMHQPLNASLLFSSISLFDMLGGHMMSMVYYVPLYIKGKVSLDRITAFLTGGEPLPSDINDKEDTAPETQPEIYIRNAEFTWNIKQTESLDHYGRREFKLRINDEIRFINGKLNLITGPTGSGKTSLLMSLLGEMVFHPLSTEGAYSLPRNRGVAFGAQESWVMNDTIRGNILFGAEYEEDRYKKVIRQTALDKDLSLFDAGDMTEVGEKGITLSGGQKARITLARAVYSKAQVVLLDDILSALDVHTARWVVDHCLGGDLLSGRTVLLVTHNVLLAKSVAQYAVSLSLNGTIHGFGPLEDVLQRDAELRNTALEGLKEMDKEKKEADDLDETEESKAASGKLIVAEETALGHVSWPAFKLYLASLGGPLFYIVVIGTLVGATLAGVATKKFLAYWADQYEFRAVDDVPVKLYLLIYFLISFSGDILDLISWGVYLFGVIRASTEIHQQLIHSILTSTLRWLDTTPVARVITRCSQDTAAVDDRISSMLNGVAMIGLAVAIYALSVVIASGWQMLFLSFGVIAAGITAGHIYMTAQLPLKRLMSNAKSPIISHVQTALAGLVSVRAYGAQKVFQSEMRQKMDHYSQIAHPYWDLNRWIAVRIDTIGGVFSGVLAAWLVYGRSSLPGEIGFSLALISNFNMLLLQLVRMTNQLEVQANSLERIRDYFMIEHEPEASEDGKPPAYWPASGELHVENLSARYSKDGPEVLKDVTFTVKSGERVGVVGRTGAGKSTLGLALLRAVPTTGIVRYDGIDVATINLEALRSKLSIIPQNPDLLAGTIRENLDPLGEQDDAVLNDALNSAGLSHLQTEDGKNGHGIGLDTKVESGGSNFSQGQRQIIALARAFVRQAKVLIMDEATAAIDYNTDHMIQQYIRSQFKDVTVVTVAHRLRTIMDFDKILVLDAGRVSEWASPKDLLQKSTGVFKSLVDSSPDKKDLYAIAGLPTEE